MWRSVHSFVFVATESTLWDCGNEIREVSLGGGASFSVCGGMTFIL